jgi:tripartite-type tricarboxylate transporter receptor subunit TctC
MNAKALIASNLQRRQLVMAGLGAAGWLGLGIQESLAQTQAFPTKPIRVVVPFPPGGPTDIVARPLAQMLSVTLKQQVIVDNKGGAGGSIAAEAVSKSPPDGYTLLLGTVGTHAINSALYKKLQYDPIKDFTPLGLAATAPVAVVVNATSPYTTIAELIAAAKKLPDSIAYGSAGNGSPGHLTGELFATAAGIKLKHIPYKGSAPAVTDLLGAQIQLMFDPIQSVLPHIQGGRLRALAISSKNRSSVLPQVPTLDEAGLRGFEAEAWWAVYAPAKLPQTETALLRKEIQAVIRSEEFRGKLINLGMLPATLSIEDFPEFSKRELAKWGTAVRDSGASID